MTHPNPAAEHAPHQPPAQPAPQQQAQQPNQQAPQQQGQPADPQQQQPPQPPTQPQGGYPAGPPPGAMPPPGWQGHPGGPGAPGGPGGPGAQTGPIPVAQQPSATGVAMTPATWCRLAALLATPLGLSIPFDSTCMWVSMTAWAAFAMLAAIVQAVPMFKGASSSPKDWTIGAVGAGCLLLFWVLVALPSVASNSGFTLTVAAVAAAAGAAVAPGRRW